MRKVRLVSAQQEAAQFAKKLAAVSAVAVYFLTPGGTFCAVDAGQSYVGFGQTEEALVGDLKTAGFVAVCLDDLEARA